jgi:hypothetical protein
MRHLTPGDFVDLAEGARDAQSVPHLAACDVCRRRLADLRAAMAGISRSEGGIPEPSPLFWDHLSARVRDGVRNEDVPARTFHSGSFLTTPRLAFAAVWCVVAIAIGATFGSRLIAPQPQAPIAPLTTAPAGTVANVHNAPITTPDLPGSADDPSFSLVADYGKTLDWDELREQMSVPAHTGIMDAAAGELNAEERQELHRLLTEQLTQPAARTDRS